MTAQDSRNLDVYLFPIGLFTVVSSPILTVNLNKLVDGLVRSV